MFLSCTLLFFVKKLAYFFIFRFTYLLFTNLFSKLLEKQQETADKISVGCVIGVIDIIHNTHIIDIKCCSKDDLKYYRKQMFAYACLHRLRYGNIMTHAKIFNFLTDHIYIMSLSNLTDEIALNHVKKMGNHCEYHLKLFN